MRWLNDNTTMTFEHLADRAENDIDQLRDEAIGDLFDHARNIRLQRRVGGQHVVSNDDHEAANDHDQAAHQ